MKMQKIILSLAGMTLIAVGLMGFVGTQRTQVPVQTSQAPQCLPSRSLDTEIIDANTILMSHGKTRIKVTVDGCELDGFHILQMTYRGSSWICDAQDLEIRSIQRAGSNLDTGQYCFVRDYQPITNDEAKALLKNRTIR